MWQPNERKRGPRNWAQKLVSVVPHGVLPKFQKKNKKNAKRFVAVWPHLSAPRGF